MSEVDYDAWAKYLSGFIVAACEEMRPRVIDCGCGTGTIMLRLLKDGMDVTGVDISQSMLLIAQEKLRRAGYRKAPLVCEDMRQLQLHRPADALIASCDSVNYLTSDKDAASFFNAAFHALKPGGLLLFDISSVYKMTHILDGHTFGEDEEGCAFLCHSSFDKKRQRLQMDLSLFARESNGFYSRKEETHVLRAYETGFLCELLKSCGFHSVKTYDAFTIDAPRSDSERIQFHARRMIDG